MVENLDSKPIQKKKKGGPRPGSGRKKGQLSPQTIEKIRTFEEYKARVQRNADQLFNAQMQLARGVSYLFRIDKDKKGNKLKPVRVTDPDEMADYLEGKFDGDPESYFFIAADKPNTITISDMLDRAFGKATQPISGDPKNPIQLRILDLDPVMAKKYGVNPSTTDNRSGQSPVPGH